jgi:hypothetical protein
MLTDVSKRIQGGDGRDFEINLGRKARHYREWRGGVTTFARPCVMIFAFMMRDSVFV